MSVEVMSVVDISVVVDKSVVDKSEVDSWDVIPDVVASDEYPDVGVSLEKPSVKDSDVENVNEISLEVSVEDKSVEELSVVVKKSA